MVHVVTGENRSLYRPEIEAMFRMRHQVFVEDRGWQLPCVTGQVSCQPGVEVDQFDLADTVYLLDLHPNGDVQGSMRLIPTTEGTVLTDIFPHLCIQQVPHSARIWESSRGHIGRNCRDKMAWHRITLAMLEFSLLWDVEQIVFVIDTFLLPKWLSIGVSINPLGPPTDVNGESYVACALNVSPEALRIMREATGINTPSITHITGLSKAA
jgi:acyl-homoserine lactone synthase